MTDTRENIQEALYAWAARIIADEGLETPLVWLPFEGARHTPPFIGLEWRTQAREGQPWRSKINEAGEQVSLFDVKIALSLHGYGAASFDALNVLYDALNDQEYARLLKERGLVIPSAENMVEAPAAIDNSWETQEVFDFYVTYIRRVVTHPGWIERTIITPTGRAIGQLDIG
jgi:hypothetical protein